MISNKNKERLKQFKESMAEARKSLHGPWVQMILKKKKLSRTKYQKLYNMLVNWRAGRCYRSSLRHKGLVNEMIELANKYKNLEL